MAEQPFGPIYDGTPICKIIDDHIPPAKNDFLVYVMGPYTAFDAEKAYDDADELDSAYIEDPLFQPDKHITDGKATYEAALTDLCSIIRDKFEVRPFIASDVPIPTTEDVEKEDLDEPGLAVPDQSVEFAAVSHAVIFIFSKAGLNGGVGGEAGAILGEFNLRRRTRSNPIKPRERFRLFGGPGYSSAMINEMSDSYGVPKLEFESQEELKGQIGSYLVEVQRRQRSDDLPRLEREFTSTFP